MAPVLGVILAGGLSRRMGGGDKALARLAGRSLLERVHQRFSPQCGAGVILNANGNPARFAGFPGLVVPDGVTDHPGPLAGILAALDHAAANHPSTPHVASVTGDAPFLPLDLVDRLEDGLGGAPIAMASSAGRHHFTVAMWAVSLRDDLRAALVDRGERRVGAFLTRHGAAAVEWPAEPVDPFLNINTPEDLAVAEQALARIEAL